MTNVVATMNLTSKTGWPTSFPFVAVIEPGSLTNQEVVDVTSLVSGNNFNVTRGADGSTGVAHSNGVQVLHEVTARDYTEANTHVNATGVVHGLSGSIVGTSDSQTLTNKTVNGNNNTLSNLVTFQAFSGSASVVTGATATTVVSFSATVPAACQLAEAVFELTYTGTNQRTAFNISLGGTVMSGDGLRWVSLPDGSTYGTTKVCFLASPSTGAQTLLIKSVTSTAAVTATASISGVLKYYT
ncbi:hypothetical protein [Fodinicola feengrottensis]|nr:hypothetical protein [Fodinicola feengrottensis]